MPTPSDIGIFNIGRTMVDRAEVQRWLDFIGVQEFTLPDEGSVTNPALLIALAAKRCYKSFEPGLNPNVTRVRSDYNDYFENILKVGHGSVLEHSVYNFAIENISRVFTGEMNRHRAGWAISEGSMRFIRYSESIPYWVPTSIQGPSNLRKEDLDPEIERLIAASENKDQLLLTTLAKLYNGAIDVKKQVTREIFTKAFSSTEVYYRVMEALWAKELAPDSKFKGKKEITSMMRRIVGMGVATGGVWSGNIRGLRHVLTMRAAPEAEEEICHVFTRVAKLMRDMEPQLFGDFYQDENGYWRPKYIKV